MNDQGAKLLRLCEKVAAVERGLSRQTPLPSNAGKPIDQSTALAIFRHIAREALSVVGKE